MKSRETQKCGHSLSEKLYPAIKLTGTALVLLLLTSCVVTITPVTKIIHEKLEVTSNTIVLRADTPDLKLKQEQTSKSKIEFLAELPDHSNTTAIRVVKAMASVIKDEQKYVKEVTFFLSSEESHEKFLATEETTKEGHMESCRLGVYCSSFPSKYTERYLIGSYLEELAPADSVHVIVERENRRDTKVLSNAFRTHRRHVLNASGQENLIDAIHAAKVLPKSYQSRIDWKFSIASSSDLVNSQVKANLDELRINLSLEDNKFSFLDQIELIDIEPQYRDSVASFVRQIRVPLTLKSEFDSLLEFNVTLYDFSEAIEEANRLASLGRGYVRLSANMDGVDIFVDGKQVGRIEEGKPFVGRIIEGRHTIQAKKDFYGAKTVKIDLEADDAFAYHFDLKQSGNLAEELGTGKIVQSTGELVVVTTKNHLSVLINGQTRIPPFKLPNIASGIHKMKVIDGDQEKVISITVPENKRETIDLDEFL